MNNYSTVSINEAATLIGLMGDEITYLVQGPMGTGKTSILKILAEKFPSHLPCYFDCTTKVDGGDLALPNVMQVVDGDAEIPYVKYVTNEELGVHHNKPIILMLDEIGKNRALLPALTGLMQERKVLNTPLPKGSIVFATTNMATENVGDFIDPHQHNRITQLLMRKPSSEEWIAWGINNQLHSSVLGFAQEFPQIFESYTDVQDPKDNPYIHHPKDAARTKFITPRSLEKCSTILLRRDTAPEDVTDPMLDAALTGTVGARAAKDMAAFVKLSGKLPKLNDIWHSPSTAMVPDNLTAICMTLFNVMGAIEDEHITNWMTYLDRLPPEAQAMFVNGVTAKEYNTTKQKAMFRNKSFLTWLKNNKHLYTANKK